MLIRDAWDMKQTLYKHLKKGRTSHICFVCEDTTSYSYEQKGWWKTNHDYYLFGTKKVCKSCVFESLETERFKQFSGMDTNEVENMIYQELVKALKNKDFIENIKEERLIDDFIEHQGSRLTLRDGSMLIRTAGIGFENRQEIIKKMSRKNNIIWEREPQNPHDENAIAIYTFIDDEQHKIGYVPAVISKELAPQMDAGTNTFEIQIYRFPREEYIRWIPYEYETGHTEFEKEISHLTGVILKVRC